MSSSSTTNNFRLEISVETILNLLKSISSLKCDETRGWRCSNTEIPRNIEVGMKEVEGNVSFFAVLSSDWPGVVICWSPRCRRPEVGPWLFVQRRWLPTRAIWNDGVLWKMNIPFYPHSCYLFEQQKYCFRARNCDV